MIRVSKGKTLKMAGSLVAKFTVHRTEYVFAYSSLPFTRVRKQAHIMRLIRHADDVNRRPRTVLDVKCEEADSKASCIFI